MSDCYRCTWINVKVSNERLSAAARSFRTHEKAEILGTVTNPNAASPRSRRNLTPENAYSYPSWFMGHGEILRCVKFKQSGAQRESPYAQKTISAGVPNLAYRVNIVIHFHRVVCGLDFFQTTLRLFTSFQRHCLHVHKSNRQDDREERKVKHFLK